MGIFQVKQNRIDKMMKAKFEKDIQAESVEGTSGGEEVSKILDDARRKYGKIQSFRQLTDKENINLINPKIPPDLNSQKLNVKHDYNEYVIKSKEDEDSEDHDDVDHLKKKYFPKPKKKKFPPKKKKKKKKKKS